MTVLRTFTPAVLLLLAMSFACSSTPKRDARSAAIFDLVGARTRVVWVQGDGTDPYANGRNLILKGFDTDDGNGERVILGERGSYVKPLLTPRGNRVLFSTHPLLGEPSVYLVNFDGTGLRRLAAGFALATWADPADASEWVYVGTDAREYLVRRVSRFRIDQPDRVEVVWTQSAVTIDTFQVSPDGRLAGGLFPWPAVGVADLTAGSWRRFGEGCWTALQHVGTPLLWYFDGAHRNLLMVDIDSDRRWTLPINVAPGFDNPEVYHPRWSNHPRFMAISGPYDQGGPNQVRTGGNQSEIWLGRFNEDFTAIEAWARVSQNEWGDSYPDVWVDVDRSRYPRLPAGRVGPAVAPVAADAGRAVVEARLVTAGAIPTPEAIAPYRDGLVVNVYDVVSVIEGQAERGPLLVAQWAIRDGKPVDDARRAPGAIYRLTIERYDAHPELEGARLSQGPHLPNRPLYVDVARLR